MNICTADKCERPKRRNGPRTLYCERHTYYVRRYGDATKTSANSHDCVPQDVEQSPSPCGVCGRLLSTVSAPLRFWALVQITDTCWLWEGSLTDGYGKFEPTTHIYYRAHRYAYEMIVGPIPEGLTLDHLCRVRHCVNPSHLEPVSIGENNLRGESIAAQNARKTICKYGHPLDADNTWIVPSTGFRRCRTCARRNTNAWRDKQKEDQQWT